MHDNREILERRIERTLVERILPAQYAKLTPIHLDHYRLPLVAWEGGVRMRQGGFSHGKGAFVCDKGVFAWEGVLPVRQGRFSHGEVSDLEQVGYKDKVLAKNFTSLYLFQVLMIESIASAGRHMSATIQATVCIRGSEEKMGFGKTRSKIRINAGKRRFSSSDAYNQRFIRHHYDFDFFGIIAWLQLRSPKEAT